MGDTIAVTLKEYNAAVRAAHVQRKLSDISPFKASACEMVNRTLSIHTCFVVIYYIISTSAHMFYLSQYSGGTD